MLIVIPVGKPAHCLHDFFGPGDEVEFDFSDAENKEELEHFPKGVWGATVVGTGCDQLCVKPFGEVNYILANRCGNYVRLIAASTKNEEVSPVGHRVLRYNGS